ncbi:hypothetical protein [Streptomyces sp. NPDC059278]|uniref:hypothetical protein n=1 Tax=Streptomyces sp. NPDC059278 TaxID=3346801 RepID=UPI0036A86842
MTTVRLGRREREMILLRADGLTVPESADTLGIMRNTGASHYNAAKSKLGVSGGSALIHEAYMAEAVDRPEPDPGDGIPVCLHDEEHQVLILMTKGLDATEMATALGWSVYRARKTARHLMATLGAKNASHTIKRAWQLGLLGPEKSHVRT